MTFAATLALLTLRVELPPAGMRTSTWVREDLFAGFLVKDAQRFAQGEAKLEEILATNPKAADAIAWKGGARLHRAALAHEAGDAAQFRQHYQEALGYFRQAAELGLNNPNAQGVRAITGGSWTVMAERLPEPERRYAYTQIRENYAALKELQKKEFDQLPVHLRGEVLAGLAQAAQRLGQNDFIQRVKDVVAQVPGSIYATRAQKWLDNPASAAKTSMTCQTCHEPGKLAPTLERLKAKN